MTDSSNIQFYSTYRPAVADGDYTITVTQTVQTQSNPPQAIAPDTFASTRNFSVLGPRFALGPSEVHAVFPPSGSLGEYSGVLPHIVLNRATLPWERSASPMDNGKDNSQDPTWLALLVLYDDELANISVNSMALSALSFPSAWGTGKPAITLSNGSLFYGGLGVESGQHPDDQAQIITIDGVLLSNIIPSKDELQWLTHARQATDPDPFAIVFSKRLPKPNGQTTVHLVSLEGLYSNDRNFIQQNINQQISLVSLQSWSFACISPQHDFKSLLMNLFSQTLRLPGKGPQSEPYLDKGLAPFPHTMKQGNSTVSWYRGPFLPGKKLINTSSTTQPEFSFPALNADSLMRFYADIGMFDVSYAAAWELGRLLILQNKRVSVDLYNWKRAHIQQQKDARQQLNSLLSSGSSSAPAEDMPDSVAKWFEQLTCLNGVPFNYLVPDEQMLPPESIRFFVVDAGWVACLLDGAYSVGRVLGGDLNQAVESKTPSSRSSTLVSGILLRSAVVSGYPDMLVDGFAYNQPQTQSQPQQPSIPPLLCLRMERLSNDVVLCLFAGEIDWVAIHQKPESLHFGFDNNATPPSYAYYKELRNTEGSLQQPSTPTGSQPQTSSSASSSSPQSSTQASSLPKSPQEVAVSIDNNRVVDIIQLQQDICAGTKASSWNAAQFAMEMIEGVQKVNFIITDPTNNEPDDAEEFAYY